MSIIKFKSSIYSVKLIEMGKCLEETAEEEFLFSASLAKEFIAVELKRVKKDEKEAGLEEPIFSNYLSKTLTRKRIFLCERDGLTTLFIGIVGSHCLDYSNQDLKETKVRIYDVSKGFLGEILSGFGGVSQDVLGEIYKEVSDYLRRGGIFQNGYGTFEMDEEGNLYFDNSKPKIYPDR